MSSQGRGAIWAERAVVALILASLAGAVHLVISVHRRALSIPGPVAAVATAPPAAIAKPAEPPPQVVSAPQPPKPAPPPPAPGPPAEDPTKKAIAALADATARETGEAERLDARAEELEKARASADAGAESWRRREMLVKQQLSRLVRQADQIDRQADELAVERDVLARERDALKAARAKAPGEGSFAVLPYKGENGTWRRPIVLECTNGSVTLRPNGPSFSMLDLSGLINPRSSPVIVSIARELLKIQGSASPDGAPVVPYFVFLVRPDGIRPYYEARARLEPLGIAFGYELIDQDLQVNVPDFDDVATWDGSTPLDVPPSNLAALGGGKGAGQAPGTGGSSAGAGLNWPGAGASGGARSGGDVGALAGAFGSGRGTGSGTSGGRGQGTKGGGDSPDDFVWPSAPGGGAGSRGGSTAGGTLFGSPTASAERGDRAGGVGSGRERTPGVKADGGMGFDELPPLEPAGPSLGDARGGGASTAPPVGTSSDAGRKNAGESGVGAGARIASQPRGLGATGVGASAGTGLKAMADGYEGGRLRGNLSDAPGSAGLKPPAVARREAGAGGGPRGGTEGSASSNDRNAAGEAGFGSGPEARGRAGAAGSLASSDRNDGSPGASGGSEIGSDVGGRPGAVPAPIGVDAEAGGASPADLAAAAAAVAESASALGKPEPGLMWGRGAADSTSRSAGTAASGLDPGGMPGMDPKALAGLDPKALAGLDLKALAGLDPKALAGLDPKALEGLDPKALAGLDPKALAGLDPSKLAGLDPKMLAGLDPKMLAGLDPKTLKALQALGSTGAARALLGLGLGQKAAKAGGLNSPPTGAGLGVGLPGGTSSSSPGGGSALSLGAPSGSAGSAGSASASASASGSASASAEDAPFIKGRDEGRPSPPIEVPFEIVVACGADGLVVHPGGYRITSQSLKDERADSLLVRQLVAVAVRRAEADPGIRPKPRVSFLVENNGGSTFWEARRQVLFSGLDWPMTLHVSGTQTPRLVDREAW